ncbi:hypothetical protein AX17_006065 [Amanita inopinata Kibby_2008]|nr:hypothetical protein AX17_006065 [Amanita inopinata Kibby_2008]
MESQSSEAGSVIEIMSDSSDTSVGEDFRGDLECALRGNSDIPGNYAYSSAIPSTPNPCLTISGLGLISLPLSSEGAKKIIGRSSQAPYGQGNLTLVNKQVRDTWEIEPGQVKFENPEWEKFVQGLMVEKVCPALGVEYGNTPPRNELHKLLLYETGSRFLSHQDTQKADGMFATMIVLLPSQYAGGQVHVTHGSDTQVFDFSSSSFGNAAVLAWYTDVMHEVKPVTSGYRFALSYNLIHTSSRNISRPFPLESNATMEQLQTILRKWKKGAYDDGIPPDDYVVYLLQHEYCQVELNTGEACLKGEDAYHVSCLRKVAEELGYMLCLGNFESHIVGSAEDDYMMGYSKRHRYSGFGSGTPAMVDEIDSHMTLENVVDLNGRDILGPKGTMHLDSHNIVPQNAFEDVEPDKVEFEGYTGNEGASVEYWYHRTAIILLPEDKFLDVFGSDCAIKYMMNKFKQSQSGDSPTQKDRETARAIIKHLNLSFRFDTYHLKEEVYTLLDYAFKWKDIEMWRDIVTNSAHYIELSGKRGFVAAWRHFGFEAIQPGLEDYLLTMGLCGRLSTIRGIPSNMSEADNKDHISAWCENQTTKAVASYIEPDSDDVPFLISLACDDGIERIQKLPISKMVRDESVYTFLTTLIEAVYNKRKDILSVTKDQSHSGESETRVATSKEDALDVFIKKCLKAAIKQWNLIIAEPATFTVVKSQRERIVHLVRLCITTREMELCHRLLDLVWDVPGEIVSKFDKIYTPLVPHLCGLLRKSKTGICTPPFSEFLRKVVASFLHHVLGTKHHNPRPPPRKIGCGQGQCEDCRELDAFLAGESEEYTIRVPQTRRTHLEMRMGCARDLVSYTVIRSGRPHGLLVKKRGEVTKAASWQGRQKKAQVLLNAIGMGNVRKIMGNRFVDVEAALNGSKGFVLDEVVIPDDGVPNESPASGSVVAGAKRKRVPNTLPG